MPSSQVTVTDEQQPGPSMVQFSSILPSTVLPPTDSENECESPMPENIQEIGDDDSSAESIIKGGQFLQVAESSNGESPSSQEELEVDMSCAPTPAPGNYDVAMVNRFLQQGIVLLLMDSSTANWKRSSFHIDLRYGEAILLFLPDFCFTQQSG
ncbi:uncharacterized protein LOC135491726 [Lineus longissimus]|uniref:uncharacterized protein LOC135491726 n=1 Tax=Lineus longissimus TaxID=88925 RepID=UPI002B4F835F